MTLQLHRPDGRGGLEPRPVEEKDWRRQLSSPRGGAALKNGRLPELANPEMNPTRTWVAVVFWLALGALTLLLLLVGYGTGFWG
jgi:hypothetical protein